MRKLFDSMATGLLVLSMAGVASAAVINYVAYRNTLVFLQRRLDSIYQFADSPESQRQLRDELDTQIEKDVNGGDGNVLIQIFKSIRGSADPI